MNKRYIDFVPVNGRKTEPGDSAGRGVSDASAGRAISGTSAGRGASGRGVSGHGVQKPKTERPEVKFSSRTSARKHVAENEDLEPQNLGVEPEFGVVKDLAEAERELALAKKAGAGKAAGTQVAKAEATNGAKVGKTVGKSLGRPKFVNTEKVVKRPLSKNVYPKKAIVEKEEPKKTVTIIEKPEKDSKVGIVVAVILTIILGAAAGTVAFLLLPK